MMEFSLGNDLFPFSVPVWLILLERFPYKTGPKKEKCYSEAARSYRGGDKKLMTLGKLSSCRYAKTYNYQYWLLYHRRGSIICIFKVVGTHRKSILMLLTPMNIHRITHNYNEGGYFCQKWDCLKVPGISKARNEIWEILIYLRILDIDDPKIVQKSTFWGIDINIFMYNTIGNF